ncbi:MAG: hypothetical protein ACR2NR_21645, partial [Solirubrobacteraceae bacterium]
MLFGQPTIERKLGQSPVGTAKAFRFLDRSTGKVSTIAVYVDARNRATRMIAGVYSDHGGAPGTRLTWGSRASLKAGAWNRIAVRPVSLAKKSYWLAVLGKRGTLRFRDRSGRSCTSQSSRDRKLRALPLAWERGRQMRGCQLSAYAGGTVATVRDGPAPVGPPSGGGPPPAGPPVVACTTTVSSMVAVSSAVASAAGGSVICIAPGSYTGLSLSGAHSSDVVVESEPSLDPRGAGKVTI